MKKIKMMPNVTVKDGKFNRVTGDRMNMPFSMKEWLDGIINSHEHFGKGIEGVRQALRIKESYEKAKVPSTFQLEDADYKELHTAMEQSALNPQIAMTCMTYYDAMEDALDVEVTKTVPKKKTKR